MRVFKSFLPCISFHPYVLLSCPLLLVTVFSVGGGGRLLHEALVLLIFQTVHGGEVLPLFRRNLSVRFRTMNSTEIFGILSPGGVGLWLIVANAGKRYRL